MSSGCVKQINESILQNLDFRLENVRDLLARCAGTYSVLSAQKEEGKRSLSLISEQVEEESKHNDLLSRSSGVMKDLIGSVMESRVLEFEKFLSSAIQYIFYDKQFSIRVQLSEVRSMRGASIILDEVVDGSVLSLSMDSVGGGIQVVVGFLSQVYFIIRNNQAPIIFADEAFTQVSSSYISRLIDFVKSLASAYDFKLVLITHDLRLKGLGDKIYHVSGGRLV